MKMTPLRWLWAAVVIAILFVHLLVGTLVAISTVFYWLVDKHLKARQPRSRLSDTREIQLVFQQEMVSLIREAVGDDITIPIPRSPSGIINGAEFLKAVDEMSERSLPDLGFKPEQIQVLKTLTYLLAQCSRVEATKQNLALFEPLFHPGKPTTPTVAEAFDEVAKKITGCIEPVYAEVK
jgi:hypothetical protein